MKDNKKILLIFSLFFIINSLLFITFPVFAGLEECKAGCDLSQCGEKGGLIGSVSDECRCCGCCELIDFLRLARGVGEILTKVVGIIVLIFFIVGGVIWIFSAGDPEKIKRGKQILIGSLIGLLIVLFAWQIVNLVICALTQGKISEACKIFGREWYKFPQ